MMVTRGSQNRMQMRNSTLNGASKLMPQSVTAAKSRTTFYLNTNLFTKVARGLAPKNIFNIRKSARSPTKSIDQDAITSFCEYNTDCPF
jgi:hypothetical protein